MRVPASRSDAPRSGRLQNRPAVTYGTSVEDVAIDGRVQDATEAAAHAARAPPRVPWTGRVSAIDGDIAVNMTDLGSTGTFGRVVVTVRNDGPSDVTNVRVARALRSADIVTVASLKPGEAHPFLGDVQASSTVSWVESNQIESELERETELANDRPPLVAA